MDTNPIPPHDDVDCLQDVYRLGFFSGINDSHVMEWCHLKTDQQIRTGLMFEMGIKDSTAFKEEHCIPTYDGFQCEYGGIAMRSSQRLQ
jgi:hypothetical protein